MSEILSNEELKPYTKNLLGILFGLLFITILFCGISTIMIQSDDLREWIYAPICIISILISLIITYKKSYEITQDEYAAPVFDYLSICFCFMIIIQLLLFLMIQTSLYELLLISGLSLFAAIISFLYSRSIYLL